MEPWQSWAIAIVGAAAIYYYYFNQNKPTANRTRSASLSDAVPTLPKVARRREESRPKPKAATAKASGVNAPQLSAESGEDSVATRGAEPTKKRKAGKKQSIAPSPVPSPAPAAKRQELDNDAHEEEDNKAWAKQLASLKKGTSLAPPSRTDSRGKTVKQSAATFSSASSNAADADDDLTPALSPSAAAGDVSDMLEPTSTGPSVLRVTGSSQPAKAKKPQQQTQAEAQETKKQRQNRKKIEERRLEREADERERQSLLENQRRTAREARGEPARNGVPVSKPPTTSAWAEQAAARATEPPAVSVTGSNAPLLDTFDGNIDTKMASGQDQPRQAQQESTDESGWNTITKGKKQKKRAPVVSSEDSNTSDAGSVHNAPIEKPAAPYVAPAPAYKPTSASTNGYSSLYDAGSHPEDSQWAA